MNENQASKVTAILGYLRALLRAHHVAVIVNMRGHRSSLVWMGYTLTELRHDHPGRPWSVPQSKGKEQDNEYVNVCV